MNTQFAIISVMAAFYAAYFIKVIQQRRKGTATMILGKGNKPEREKNIELAIKALTFSMPVVELLSIWWNLMTLPSWWQWIGVGISALGVLFFCAGMLTMKDNWRAGIPEKKETSLVTRGIYRISRNPAFVGFDLLYLGILTAFPNAWHACFVAGTAYVFHLQILSEENYLTRSFGDEYMEYKKQVRRYL